MKMMSRLSLWSNGCREGRGDLEHMLHHVLVHLGPHHHHGDDGCDGGGNGGGNAGGSGVFVVVGSGVCGDDNREKTKKGKLQNSHKSLVIILPSPY